MKSFFRIFIFWFSCSVVCAQSSVLDSLENVLKTSKEDTNKVNVLNKLFNANRNNQIDTAYKYATRELILSKKLGYKKAIAEALVSQGFVFYYHTDFSKALDSYLQAYHLFEEENNIEGMINCSNAIAKIHRIEKNYPKAFEYSKNAIHLAEKSGNKKEMVLNYIGLGNIYGEQGMFDEGIEANQKALQICKEIRNNAPIPTILNNIAQGYKEKGFIEKAMEYELEALKMKNTLIENSKDKFDKKDRAGLLNSVSELYYLQGSFSESLNFAKQALADINEAGVGKEKKDIYEMLSKVYAGQKNYPEAYKYYLLYSNFKDSMLNETRSRQIAEMQTKYETEKKEKENLELMGKTQVQELIIKSEDQKRKNQLMLSFVFAGLLAATSFFVYNRRKLKQKALHQAEIAEQEKIRFKAIIEAEEKERGRIAQELHDGLGQMLSTARLNVAGLEDSVVEEDKQYLEKSLKIIDDACVEVRNISHNMMPNALMRLGLISAIRELVNNVNSSKTLRIDFSSNVKESLGKSLDITIYRIVQEVLNNMIKHAKADHINLDLNRNGKNLIINIKDNGIGFNTDELKESKGMGWKNIFSRVSMLNGTIELNSKPKEGTIVYINLTLKDE
jgi:two-component system, NarL family, sensor kinase